MPILSRNFKISRAADNSNPYTFSGKNYGRVSSLLAGFRYLYQYRIDGGGRMNEDKLVPLQKNDESY